jgi:two-component system chemotaxis response regulator CheB
MVRVLVVDDTALYRKVLSDVLTEIDQVEVVGVAGNGKTALAKIERLKPDMVILDFEMPDMDGLATLQHLKKSGSDVAVVMVSSHTKEGAAVTVRALELGALTFVSKPKVTNPLSGREFLRDQLRPVVKGIIAGRTLVRSKIIPASSPIINKSVVPARKGSEIKRHSSLPERVAVPPAGFVQIAVIGISTGGPNALAEVIPLLPANFRVPIVIVQHMPPVFTTALAESLDKKSANHVVEGQDGMILVAGNIYIAPGGYQMKVAPLGDSICLRMTDDPPENHCKPAADYLFRSIAKAYGKRALGVIMTGMGSDGTIGLKEMKTHGAQVVAQDEKSCIVFGMPLEAIKAGVVDVVVPLSEITSEIVKRVN